MTEVEHVQLAPVEPTVDARRAKSTDRASKIPARDKRANIHDGSCWRIGKSKAECTDRVETFEAKGAD